MCPYCYRSEEETLQQRISQRMKRFREICGQLPGSEPYDNHRPLNVPLRFCGRRVEDFLTAYHPHVDSSYWQDEVKQQKILYRDQPVEPGSEVWAGQRLVHLLAGTIEPDVNADLKLIFEDDDLLAIDKPAPIPMHPCGRFNRNTVSYLLNAIYVGEKIRMTHRLDANTTGVVIFARKRLIAQRIQAQFESGKVEKTYFARVVGIPQTDRFQCEAKISREPGPRGLRVVDNAGLAAVTHFELLEKFADDTSLIECKPVTGRTNQIRIHLWQLGFPIVNDPSYLPDRKIGRNQTLEVHQPAMCLHAGKLCLWHPASGERIAFTAPLPDWCKE